MDVNAFSRPREASKRGYREPDANKYAAPYEHAHDAHFNDMRRADASLADARLAGASHGAQRFDDTYDDAQPYEDSGAQSRRHLAGEYSAPRRQTSADDDVHYTTNPFPPRGRTQVPARKPGLGSRVLATACLAASAMFGAAALVLTLFMQVYIAVPAFLIAGALFYFGRGSLRESAKRANDKVGSDPARRREPDLGD